eukprot:4810017-Lingulodinium_polyedra.AAC.1
MRQQARQLLQLAQTSQAARRLRRRRLRNVERRGGWRSMGEELLVSSAARTRCCQESVLAMR